MQLYNYTECVHSFSLEWNFGLAKLIRSMQRTNVAPSPLIHNMAGFGQETVH